MLRILHISDLHICTSSVKYELCQLSEALGETLPRIAFDIHTANPDLLDALARHIQAVDPDVIALTGDVTALGDYESFEEAFRWIDPLLMRSGGQVRPCVVVPGNHDALLDHLSALYYGQFCELPSFKWKLIKLILRRFFKVFSPLEHRLDQDWKRAGFLKAYREFVDKSSCLHADPYALRLGDAGDCRVTFFPFSTVSSDPIWMNAGFARRQVWERLNATLADESYGVSGTLRIALAHHNPLSSPGKVETELVHAYNSMPGGTEFLATLQRKGIDLLMHGHQHEGALYRYDFDLDDAGHAFAIGTPSATTAEGAGTALLELADINHVVLTRYAYNPRDGFALEDLPRNPYSLALERHRPSDPLTTAVRYEIKGYSPNDDGEENILWSQVQKPGSELIYMSGRHLKLIREESFKPVRSVLTSSAKARLRILVSDPSLLETVATSTDSGNGYGSDLWGAREELENLASSARRTIDRLTKFIEGLGPTDRSRIDVRTSHTLLPFAAYVRDADAAWGKMAVKILPVGAIGDLASPVLRLNRRTNRALYDFYLAYLRYLFLKGNPVAGGWNSGETDLESELDQDVLGAILTAKEERRL